MKILKNLEFGLNNEIANECAAENHLDNSLFRVVLKAHKVRCFKLQDIYGKADFNFDIFKYALDEEFAARRMREKLKEEKNKKHKKEDAKRAANRFGLVGRLLGVNSWEGLFSLVIIFVIIIMIFGSSLLDPRRFI